MTFLYIGPGLGAATIVIVIIILAIVFFSFASVIVSSAKQFWNKIKSLFG